MENLLHPMRAYRRWRAEKSRQKCFVMINYPTMVIKGRLLVSSANPDRTYIAFMGVPYAVAPSRYQRFRAPQPLPEPKSPSNPTVVEAYSSFHPCLQRPFKPIGKLGTSEREKHLLLDKEEFGSEDCLYLNVYLPKKPEDIDRRLPVLVYFHGGEFERGSGAIEDIKPDYIIQHNVVFVTVNYRLGLFGFLNMRTEECQGNAGLKDQVEALKWIKQNIKKFKGDPENVTISGHEAGATCVNLHLISPMSKGLFHKAIVQAGGIYCPWGFKGQQQKHIIGKLKCRKCYIPKPSATREALVYALKNSSPEFLLYDFEQISREYLKQRRRKLLIFIGPSEEFREEEAFLPPGESMKSLMEKAERVPVIAGITNKEGYKYFYERRDWTETDFKKMVTDDNDFLEFLQENFYWSEASARNKMDILRRTYFGKGNVLQMKNYQTIQDDIANFLTDIWFRRFYDNFKIGAPASLEQDDPPGQLVQIDPPAQLVRVHEPAQEDPPALRTLKDRPAPLEEIDLCASLEQKDPPAPLYIYQFDYFADDRADRVKVKRRENESIRIITQTAAGHGDDENYLYNPENIKISIRPYRMTEETRNVVETMCRLWTSFCYTGIPSNGDENFEWTPHTEEHPHYLSIDRSLSMKSDSLRGSNWIELEWILAFEESLPSPLELSPIEQNLKERRFVFPSSSKHSKYGQLR